MTAFARLLVITATTLAIASGDAHAGHGNDEPLPCGAPAAQALAPDQGWQVQLDPETGTYSMPAPGTLTTPQGRSSAAASEPVVITPGTTAAGGFKVKLEGESLQKGGD